MSTADELEKQAHELEDKGKHDEAADKYVEAANERYRTNDLPRPLPREYDDAASKREGSGERLRRRCAQS
jgi:hypothetical protein